MDLLARAAQWPRHGLAVGAGEEVPAGHFEAGLGEVVAAHRTPRTGCLVGVLPRGAEHVREQKISQDVPRRLGRLRAVVRVRCARALTPAFGTFAVESAQQDVIEVVLRMARGREGSDQRQPYEVQLYGLQTVAHVVRSRR